MSNFRLWTSFLGVVLPLVFASQTIAQVRINEVMASNSSTVSDENGDHEDWIELYNGGSNPVNLSGYGLSDNYDEPYKWVFPNVTLAAGDFMLIWASGKDRANPANPLHTNFSISADGEELTLTDPHDVRIDEMSPIAMPADVSYGRKPDGAGSWFFFSSPTPDASNTTAGQGSLLSPPSFSHDGGFYANPFSLTLSAADPEVTILYTLDGSVPDEANIGGATYSYKNRYAEHPGQSGGSLLTGSVETLNYEGAIGIADRSGESNQIANISSTYHQDPWYFPGGAVYKGTVVRARAFKEGYAPSEVVTKSYFIAPEAGNRYSMAVVSLNIPEDHLFDYEDGIYVAGEDFDSWRAGNSWQSADGGVPANYHRRGDEWEYPAHLEIFDPEQGSVIDQQVGVRIHGGWSRSHPSKSLRLYARNEYGESHFQYPIFPDQPYDQYKRIFLRNGGNDWGYTLFRDAAIQYAARPLGIDIQASRPSVVFINGEYWGILNIRERYDKHYLSRVYDVEEDKVDMLSGDGWVDEGTNTHYNDTRNYIQTNGLDDDEHYQHIKTRIDVDNFIDYQIVQIFANNRDWPGNNIKFWRYQADEYDPDAPEGQDGRWRWLLYDTDFGFGLYNSSYTENTLEFATDPSGPGWPNPPWSTFLLRNLLENDSFRIAFINRFNDALNTTFRPERTTEIINQLKQLYQPEIAEHIERWKSPSNTDNWNNEINHMLNFVQNRPHHQRQHIRNYFNLSDDVEVTLNVSASGHGHVKINSMEITGQTAGVPADPYPYTRNYFNGIPVRIEAIAAPGHRFVGWDGVEEDSAVVFITPTEDIAVTAVFEADVERHLLHYWSFNDTEELLNPSFTTGGAEITVEEGPDTEIASGTGSGFAAENSQFGDEAGAHLRINNPLGASMVFSAPTTGYENIVLKYETRRSGQGAGVQEVEYSVDGDTFLEWDQVEVVDGDPAVYMFDFSSLPTVDDNEAFLLRITFEQASGSTAGNHRFDNVTVEGVPLDGTNLPPVVSTPVGLVSLIENAGHRNIDLAEVFHDANGDEITFTAFSSFSENATVSVSGTTLTITPVKRGDTEIVVAANDGAAEPVQHAFRVLIYPEAAQLSASDLVFDEWSADEPERSYPVNMLFLQSDKDDPKLNEPLLYPYYIDHDDYHADDAAAVGYPYKTTSRTRITGLESEGIAMINTGRGRDLGGILLAINTQGVSDFRLQWLCETLQQNSRAYGITLQYRIGAEGAFKNVLNGAEFNYRSNADGHARAFEASQLPPEVFNKAYVQLLWRYHHISGNSGPRAQIRLDEIKVGIPPGATQILTPVEINESGKATLAWTESDMASHYHLQIAEDIDFVNVVKDHPFISGQSFQVSGLSNNVIYYARVRGTRLAANGSWSSPVEFSLNVTSLEDGAFQSSVYPNPTRGRTTIHFRTQNGESVSIMLFDMMGGLKSEVIRGNYAPGEYEVELDMAHIAAGSYLIVIQSESGILRHKILKKDN